MNLFSVAAVGSAMISVSANAATLADAAQPPIGSDRAAEAPAGVASQDTQATPSNSAADSTLQDIVVTAQRREQSLQKVPVAVTALNTAALDQARITSVERLDGFAPNLTIVGQATVSTPVISIRGINSGTSNVAIDPKVATYLDGVYVGRNSGAIFDLADIQRVEVLRGPQGTLFGRNATAGAISIVTAAPTGELEGKALISYGNYNALRARAVLNLPAIGPLKIKLGYLHNEIDGDVRNLIAGTVIDARARDPRFGPFTAAKRLGGSTVNAFQGKARLDLGEFEADYSYDITDTKQVSRGSQVLSVVNDGGGGSLAAAVLGFQGPNAIPGYAGTGGITNLSTSPSRELASYSSQGHVTVQGHSLTMTWHPSSDLVVKNNAALRYLNLRPYLFDTTATGGLRFSAAQLGALLTGNIAGVTAPAAQPGPNDRFFTILVGDTIKQHQFSDELQVIYTGEVFDVTAGGFYFREVGRQTTLIDIFEPVANGISAPSPFDAAFGSGPSTTIARNISYAGYAQGTFHITSKLDLTGGIRFTKDKRRVEIPTISSTVVGTVPPGIYNTSFFRTNYAGILTYRPSSDVTAYAKIATGYVAGGIFSGIPYQPESLISYEIGLKTQLLNNRVRANFAAFYEDYSDLQVADNRNGTPFISNAGKAHIPGIEAEITVLPVSNLTLGGNIGYQDFKYKKYVTNLGAGPVDIAADARPLYTAKLTLQLSAQYDLPEIAGLHSYVNFNARYKSDGYNTQTPIGTTPEERARLEPLSTIKHAWVVDGRAGLTKLAFGPVQADLSFYAQNIFNVRRYDYGANILTLLATYNRPRTYGFELSGKF